MIWPRNLKFRPIGNDWPGELTKSRKMSPFTATLTETVDLLGRELRQAHAKTPVIQLALGENQLRIDGMPRAGSYPSHPGVILSFEVPQVGSVRMPADRFTQWEDNLRAIALGLEAMRKIERYGIVRDNQQYRGWKAIETRELPPTMTIEQALVVLESVLGEPLNLAPGDKLGPAELKLAYRRAQRSSHPDLGGSEQAFMDVAAAGEVLRKAGMI